MSKLNDSGEVIPHAKKDLPRIDKKSAPAQTETSTGKTKERINKRVIWPEPDWRAVSKVREVDRSVLAYFYSVYHTITSKPNQRRIKYKGYPVTQTMWDEAYRETVTHIKRVFESVDGNFSFEDMNGFEDDYRWRFESDRVNPGFYKWAAGPCTARLFYSPLSVSGMMGHLRFLLPHLDFPRSINPKKIPYVPIELQSNETGKRFFALGKVNKRSWVYSSDLGSTKNSFKSYEEAVAALVEHYGNVFSEVETEIEEASSELYTPKKDLSVFQGLDVFQVEQSGVDEFRETFGFRGIQFGNYVTQAERACFVHYTHQALSDLCRIINIPPIWIGGKKLGLAFGARGSGNAAAHYELDWHVINLTRLNGAGCIAHEIFHAFDARFSHRWLGKRTLATEVLWYVTDSAAFSSLKHAAQIQAFIELAKCVQRASSYIENARAISSQKGGRKYWDTPIELMARAFEAYIEDSISDSKKIGSNWLATGTRESDYPLNSMHPYPIGSEREEINQSFERLLPSILSVRS